MKTKITKLNRRLTLLAMLFLCTVFGAHGQATTAINAEMRACSSTANTLDFEIWITNATASSAPNFILQSGAYGFDFNQGIKNGGTVSIAYVASTSQLASGQSGFTTTNTNINPTTFAIRINAQVVTAPSAGTPLAPGVAIRVGTFRLTNTANWTSNSSPNFVWQLTPVGNKTQTKFTVYVGGSSTGSPNTPVAANVSFSTACSPMFLNAGCTLQPTANANTVGGPYSSCGPVQLNGAVGGSATAGTWSTTGTGSFSPNPNALNAKYLPSATDVSSPTGVDVTLTSNNPNGAPCTTAVSTAHISACAESFCLTASKACNSLSFANSSH